MGKGAEAQLVADLKHKADTANAAAKAKSNAAGAKGKYAHEKGQLTAAQAKLNGLKGAVAKDKQEREAVAAKVKQASEISLPEGTKVKEAHKILEKKRAEISKYSGKLLQKIQQEKADLGKKKVEQKKVQDTSKK